jgi:pyruvate ferredoxin oxidoreductase gamma subunit
MMPKDLIEIRWHGRGGQGAKTAALLFGEAAIDTGMYIQAFPEYGPERTGAPVSAFNRLSEKPIRLHSGVDSPQIVLVLDPSLLSTVDVLKGLGEGGIIIVNTDNSPEEIRKSLSVDPKIKVYTVDASKIAMDKIGLNKPNTPMLGALSKVTDILNYEKMLKSIEHKLKIKFRGKPEEIVTKNMEAIKTAHEETKGES